MTRTTKTSSTPKARLGLEPLEGRDLLSVSIPTLFPAEVSPAAPAFHSLPGARAAIYLDFNGHTQPADASFYPGQTSRPYSLDADYTTFSADERQAMEVIWRHVAEDFAPFNIDVTTAEPTGGADGKYVRVVIGEHPFLSAGGEAPLGSFRDGDDTNNVALAKSSGQGYAFWQQFPAQNAALASHEAGHVLGLGHTVATGDSAKGPIMHGSNNTRRVWWKETVNGVVYDDIADIAADNGFGFRRDEAGRNFTSAQLLRPAAGSDKATASGVVGTTADRDFFAFETAGGDVNLKVTVARSDLENNWPFMVAANLDAKLQLYRETATGRQLVAAYDPDDSPAWNDPAGIRRNLEVEVTRTLAAGRYFVVVGSHGGVGDAGQYTLSVTAPFATYSVENDGPGYSETGTAWTTSSGGSGGDFRSAPKGTGRNTAIFQLSGLDAGRYDVGVTWQAGSNRATNATYKVYDGNTLVGTVRVNQRKAPVGAESGGAVFQSLGKFNIASGSLRVVLSDAADGVVVTDALRVTPL